MSSYYSTAHWKWLCRFVKRRDGKQCQICGDREGDPYTALHGHHITPRSKDGADTPENVITLCDLCHAVVTKRWHKPWFGTAALTNRDDLERASLEYQEFLALDPVTRRERQAQIWHMFGITKAPA